MPEKKITSEHLERDLPPFTWLGNAVIDDEKLTRVGLLTYLALTRFAGFQSRTAFPSIARLAAVARLSPRSVNAGLKELRELGWLSVQAKFGEQGRCSNLYKLHDKAKKKTKPLKANVALRYGQRSPKRTQPLREPPATLALTPLQGLRSNETYLNEKKITKALANKPPAPLSVVLPPAQSIEGEDRETRIEKRKRLLEAQAAQILAAAPEAARA